MEGILLALFGILAGLLITLWSQRKGDEKLKQITDELKKQGAIPQLPKTHLIRKRIYKGILAMGEHKWEKAIDIFRKLLPEVEGNQKGALLNLIGNCFHRQKGKLDEALGFYKESLELAEKIQDKEGIVINLNNMGTVYAHKGNYDTAIRDFDKAIKIDPNYALSFNNRGLVYANKKDYDAAIRDLDKAIEIDPKLALAFYNRGLAYADKKDSDTAIRDYTRAVEIDPNYAVAFNNRGIVYGKKNDYDTAILDFTKAIKLDPNHAMAMANMGNAYKRKGDKENARIWWKKALERQEYLPPSVAEAVRQCIKELEE